MVIIVEGPDGAGKTTLARKLAEALEYQYYHFGTPEEPGNSFDERLDFLQEHNNAVIDRFWPSDIVYGEIMRGKPDITPTQAMTLERVFQNKIVMLYLTGDPSVLWQRCQERGENYVLDKDTFMKIFKLYDKIMLEDKHLIPVHPVILHGNSLEEING